MVPKTSYLDTSHGSAPAAGLVVGRALLALALGSAPLVLGDGLGALAALLGVYALIDANLLALYAASLPAGQIRRSLAIGAALRATIGPVGIALWDGAGRTVVHAETIGLLVIAYGALAAVAHAAAIGRPVPVVASRPEPRRTMPLAAAHASS
jgi:hypothetical protein